MTQDADMQQPALPADPVSTGGPRGESSPSLVVNALSSWAAFAVSVLTAFVLTPVVIAYLGKSGYGVWCLVGSMIGYYGLLDLGVSAAVRRYVARYAARNDHRALNETVSTALALFAAAGCFMIGVSVLFGRPLGRFFRVGPDSMGEFYQVIVLLGVSAAVNIIGQVYRATIAAHEYFVARNLVTIGATLLRAVLTVAALRAGWGLVGVAGSYLTVDTARFAAYLYLVRFLTPHVKYQHERLQWRRIRKLLVYGVTMTVAAGASMVQIHLASIVLARCVSLEAVAVYAVAALLVRYFSNLIEAGMGVLSPRFAGLHGVNDLGRLRRLLSKGLWISAMLSCAVALILLILGERFLNLWVGSRFSPAELATVAKVLAILTIAYTAGLSQSPGATVLYAMNSHRVYAGIMVIEAAVTVVLSVILALEFGAIGVALGALISLVGVRMIIQPLHVSRIVGMKWGQYCRPVMLPMAGAGVVWSLYRWLAAPQVRPMGYGGLLVAAIGITAAYAVTMAVVATVWALVQGRSVRLRFPLTWPGRAGGESSAD